MNYLKIVLGSTLVGLVGGVGYYLQGNSFTGWLQAVLLVNIVWVLYMTK